MNIKHIYLPIIKIAIPIIFIQVCQASLGLIDTLVAGQYHFQHLAGVGLGSNLWTPVVTLGTGVLYALVPRVSTAVSQHNYQEMHTLYQHGKNNALILMITGFILIQLLAIWCHLFIADPEVAAVTKQYLHYVAFAVPGLIYIVLTRFFCEGNSTLMPVVITTIIISAINIALNFTLVNGWGGLPELGGAGCGLATAISVSLGAVIIHFLARRELSLVFPAQSIKVNKAETKQMFVEGLPIGIAIVVEILALTVLAFFASSLGTKVIAAHQISINIAIVVFMIPLALGSATTIRIAHFVGKKQPRKVLETGNAALLLTIIYGLIMSGSLYWLVRPLLSIFSHDTEVQALLSTLLIYVIIFQFIDAIIIVSSSILRGVQEFVKPLLAIFTTYWLFVIPISYMVAVNGWGLKASNITTIWSILIIGLTFLALYLIIQAHSHTKMVTTNLHEKLHSEEHS